MGLKFWLVVIVAFIGFKTISFFVKSYAEHSAVPPATSHVPNELTRQFCSEMKVMAKQVKEGKNQGMEQEDYLRMVAENTRNFSGARNIDEVTRISEAIVKGAWMSDDGPDEYADFVHQTCLETVVLVP